MLRQLKRQFSPLLPRWLVERLKKRWAEQVNRGEIKDITWVEDGSVLRCTVGSNVSFLAPKECQHDLSAQKETLDGRAEMSGIAEVALQGGILFDIGAHAGIMSALFCGAKSTNKAYSFEPSPVSHHRLEEIRKLNHLEDRMFIQPTAIGRDRAKLEMLIDPTGGYVQIKHFEHSSWGKPEKIEVEVESIPQASERLGVIPDIIKLDIESYEYEALQGALPFLAKHKPVLLFELHHNYLEQRGLAPKAVMAMLNECGYQFSSYTGHPLSSQTISDLPLQGFRFLAKAA